jgi:hypothetical protein
MSGMLGAPLDALFCGAASPRDDRKGRWPQPKNGTCGPVDHDRLQGVCAETPRSLPKLQAAGGMTADPEFGAAVAPMGERQTERAGAHKRPMPDRRGT